MSENVTNGNDGQKNTGFFGSAKNKVLSLTALFLTVSALINSGIDLYKSVLNIPTNIYEKTNDELFKKHFKDKPIVSQPIEIKSSNLTGQMLLEVYDTGDIFVKYGDFTQWLSFEKLKTASNSIFTEAFADTLEASSFQGMTTVELTTIRSPIIIDIDKIEREQQKQRESTSNALPPKIQREFLIAEIRDIHSNFFSSSREVYEKTFSADKGYKITSYSFQSISQNKSNIERIEPLNGGLSIKIVYSISSGPAIDRWRGWIKGVLKTTQKILDSDRDGDDED